MRRIDSDSADALLLRAPTTGRDLTIGSDRRSLPWAQLQSVPKHHLSRDQAAHVSERQTRSEACCLSEASC